jgi:hypothetical protein
MTHKARMETSTIELDDLGFDRGAHLLIARALRSLPVGSRLAVAGRDPHLRLHLAAWARAAGHDVQGTTIVRGDVEDRRWAGAVRAGEPRFPAATADLTWGLAARGAQVELGGPSLMVDLIDRDIVWVDLAPKLYAHAAAAQWNPATAADWDTQVELPSEIEQAVIQVMTYLIENEQAALTVPARFLVRIHPHFREIVQLLALQVADEARHIEVFSRRAHLGGGTVGRSTVSGRASLQTLLEEPDFALAQLLLSVMGEGTFLSLLAFLEAHAPDPVTRRITHLALQDEARHVAFGQAHIEHCIEIDPGFRARIRSSIEGRHAALTLTAGLSNEIHDALVVLAAGAFTPTAIAEGWTRVQAMRAEMDEGRRRRLARLGFPPGEAAELSALHTNNFM